MIQNLLDELQTTWDFGPEELADIKGKCFYTQWNLTSIAKSEMKHTNFPPNKNKL